MRHRIGLFFGIVLGFLLASFLSQPALSFFPRNCKTLWGLLGKSHVAITTDAITDLDKEFFGVSKPTKSMQKAIDQIADANADVDDNDQVHAALHFDGESLPEGQARLVTLSSRVVDSMASNSTDAARTALGQALHTSQDFYSHSNWIENGNTSPSQDLGRAGHRGDGGGLACVEGTATTQASPAAQRSRRFGRVR